MSDEVIGSWTVDPDTRRALRLSRIRNAYQQGDLVEAMLEAEELLFEEPELPEALFLLGESLLEMGDAEGALMVFEQHAHTSPDDARGLARLGIARFENCDLTGAIESCRAALKRDGSLAEAHFCLGLALERRPGKASEAVSCLLAARQLDPVAYPLPLELTDEDWQRAVKEAFTQLPAGTLRFWRDVPLRLEERPDLAELARHDPPISPSVSGLYQGEPPSDADPWTVRPRSMRLFRENLARSHSFVELVERVAEVLEHEATGWLGSPPDPDEP